ncbi:MAG: coenzyme F420-0:L-glutamate ligase [Actinobacteria bacterium]|nr:coenzyme F420-0:L-glutamate ligase [Actinomycetota bacterium]
MCHLKATLAPASHASTPATVSPMSSDGSIRIWPVPGLPEIEAGADLAEMIHAQCVAAETDLVDGDVVIVTSKIVSKAEGACIELDDIVPSPFAASWSEAWEKDPRVVEVVLRESRRIVRQLGPVLITETHHGFVCANSGVDQSSSGAHDRIVVLPKDPDASARRMRARFNDLGVNVAVLISDTFGRPWREGQTDICVGLAGMHPMRSYIGEVDPHGHEFKVQELCVVDEVTAAAELVKGNTSRIPVAVVSGVDFTFDDDATMAPVLRDISRDLFR